MDGSMMLGAAPSVPSTFENLLSTIERFTSGFLNFGASSNTANWYPPITGESLQYLRISAYIDAVLPIALTLMATIVGIRIGIKVFKKFSR